MTGSLRAGIEDDLCRSSAGPICTGKSQPGHRGGPQQQPAPDCLLVPKHGPDMSCTRCQDQTEAKRLCLFHGDLEINFNQTTCLL